VNVLLYTIGSRGDVQPMILLGRGLAERGHRVEIAAAPDFRESVAAAGLGFLPVGSNVEQVIRDNQHTTEQNPILVMPKLVELVQKETDRQVRELLEASPQADLVVAAGLAVGARVISDRIGAAYAYVCYTLWGIRSDEHSPAALPMPPLPRFANRLCWELVIRAFNWSVGGRLNALREAEGMPRDLNPWLSVSGTETILAQDEVMGALPSDAVGCSLRVPAFVPDADYVGPLPDELERFLQLEAHRARERGTRNAREAQHGSVVYVGFGSMPTVDLERVVHAVRELVLLEDCGIVLLTNQPDALRPALPSRVFPIKACNHAQLFPRMSLLVHHGGAGTTASGLRSGVPQFIVPHVLDQFFHGRRIAELGIGPAPVPKSQFDAGSLIRAYRDARMCHARAEAVRLEVGPESGVERAVHFLEKLSLERLSLETRVSRPD
jgi:UDP:flavonoid glycosyltransferase YjiC (YdhE family)